MKKDFFTYLPILSMKTSCIFIVIFPFFRLTTPPSFDTMIKKKGENYVQY